MVVSRVNPSQSNHPTYLNIFAGEKTAFQANIPQANPLRYGENPHQKGVFYGDLDAIFDKLNGKELSYNNLLDIDAAVQLMADFTNDEPTFAILKHNNACGLATRNSVEEAYKDALAGDPVSAFGGILISNSPISTEAATEINSLFCEVVIAPDYTSEALEILKEKKNRVILRQKLVQMPEKQFRSILNGVLEQDKDLITDQPENFELKTNAAPTAQEISDLAFANKLVKHT